jgi:hypothetical protein
MNQKPMKGREVIEEFEWLIEGGWHPETACRILNRRPDSMSRLLYRYNRVDLARKFERVRKQNVQSA